MGLLILLLAFICQNKIARSCGLFSWTSAGYLAFLIYSIPAIVGLKRNFYYSGGRYLADASNYAVLVILVAWISFTITLLALPLSRGRSVSLVRHSSHDHDYKLQVYASLILSAAGIVYLMLKGGGTFFLGARDEQEINYFTLVWRWFVVIGFTASLASNRTYSTLFFTSFLAIIFLQGDRTVFAIASAIYILIAIGGDLKRPTLSAFLSKPHYLLILIIMPILIVFGKPIYLSAKDASLSPLISSLQMQNFEVLALSAEPFVTFDHIEAVRDLDIQISIADFMTSVLGNILIIPSVFGVDTNIYNETITARLPPDVRYGVAGNYWAHATAVGGMWAVVPFAVIYAAALALLDRTYINSQGRIRIGLVVLASTTAIYLHRNGMDNFLSFVRQILLAWMAISLLSKLISLVIAGRRTGYARRTSH